METDEAFILRGDIPGVSQADIEVRVEDRVLTVSGERPRPGGDARRLFGGRPAGRFERRFRLSDRVDAGGISASYQNGVLALTVPKAAPAEGSKRIPVN